MIWRCSQLLADRCSELRQLALEDGSARFAFRLIVLPIVDGVPLKEACTNLMSRFLHAEWR